MVPSFHSGLASACSAAAFGLAVTAAPALAQGKPDPGPGPAPNPIPAECDLSHEVAWGGDAASGLVATAQTWCTPDDMVWARLTVSSADGRVRHEANYPVDEVMLLAWPGENGLAGGLETWLADFAHLDTTAHLPRMTDEFPFYPAEDLTEADIDALRDQDLPMACYVQGMESANCLIREGEGVREIGLWLFPG
ncbi:hypothetical protein [Maricaulis parjimensis]|uniref:hypothetical protein n=1 Tax=Maricaulis parjimensis TaxID=144023 RepID=UPI00193A98D0|nr:hypothetical protein [Maricaulis parjimensis]